MESKKSADDIRNLLLKIIIPLAFPLAGSFICGLITNRSGNRHSDQDSSGRSIQLDLDQSSYDSPSISIHEEEEMESLNRAQQKLLQAEIIPLLTEEITVASSSEAAVDNDNKKLQDDRAMAGELEILKLAVCKLQDRASSMETEFHGYCDMKEQESSYQKMQIMCLGMKLELLESQNQRMETAVDEIRSSAGEFAVMRVKLDALQRKLKKTWKESKQEFDAVRGRFLAVDAQEEDMVRRCQSFEQRMEEMKLLTLELQEKEAKDDDEKVERSMRKVSSSKDLLDGMEALRDRWAADMEELIYLGWITAWLQHDLLVCDGSGSTAAVLAIGGDDDDSKSTMEAAEQKKGEKMVAVAAPTNEVELCKAAASSSSGWEEEEEVCMGRAGCGTAIGRPRLLHRLRGWARKGKGGSKSGSPM